MRGVGLGWSWEEDLPRSSIRNCFCAAEPGGYAMPDDTVFVSRIVRVRRQVKELRGSVASIGAQLTITRSGVGRVHRSVNKVGSGAA